MGCEHRYHRSYMTYASRIPVMTLLHTAVKYDRNEIAKLLIDHGADVNAKDSIGKSPIAYVFENGNVEIVELLLSKGAHEDGTPDLLLADVRLSKNSEIVETLLKNGSDVNSRDDFERTPLLLAKLHLAVQRKINSNGLGDKYKCTDDSARIIELLLRNGADVNARDNNCHTPLHVAAHLSNFRAVEILLEHYAKHGGVSSNVDATCEYRATALILAADKGNEKIVDILVKFGADVNFKLEDGCTSLVRATVRGHVNVVEVLLKHDADVEAKNYLGLTALDMAFEKSQKGHKGRQSAGFTPFAYMEITNLLLNHGADINAVNSLNSSMCSSFRMPLFLKMHLVTMKAANMYLDEKKFESIVNEPTLSVFRKFCEIEVESMKIKKIGNSTVSFYDILTKGVNRLAMIFRNRDIVEALQTGSYRKYFSIYSLLIKSNFERGQKRKSLLDGAWRSFTCLTSHQFSDDFTADMLRYLGNEDLKNLEQASTL